MSRRLAFVPIALLALAGLFILLFPGPGPGVCFWNWGGFGSDLGLKYCAWNTAPASSAYFLGTALFGLSLLVGAAWSAALARGTSARWSTVATALVLIIAGVLALLAYGASVEMQAPR